MSAELGGRSTSTPSCPAPQFPNLSNGLLAAALHTQGKPHCPHGAHSPAVRTGWERSRPVPVSLGSRGYFCAQK